MWHSVQHLPSPSQSIMGLFSCYCNTSLKSTYFSKGVHKHTLKSLENQYYQDLSLYAKQVRGTVTKNYRSWAVHVPEPRASLSIPSFPWWEQYRFSTKSLLHPQKMSGFFWACCMTLAWAQTKVTSEEESPPRQRSFPDPFLLLKTPGNSSLFSQCLLLLLISVFTSLNSSNTFSFITHHLTLRFLVCYPDQTSPAAPQHHSVQVYLLCLCCNSISSSPPLLFISSCFVPSCTEGVANPYSRSLTPTPAS